MLLIRFFEEKVEDLFARGLIKGTAHPAIGQEAVAVGVTGVLKRNDCMTSTHRGHGHFIARGGDPCRIMAELYGKATGYSRGRGGSQLMADYKLGFLGSNGITGGGIPLATGVALAARLRRTGQVCVCFFGDGAANQGTFHETLNMAGVWKLPVVYVCENNEYAMSTHISDSTAVAHIGDRAAAYGFPGVTVDGNDLRAVRAVSRAACDRARRGGGPTLVECKTYRLSGHSRGDCRHYRSDEEEAAARRKEPIRRFRKLLIREGVLTRALDGRIRKETRLAVREAVRYAAQSPDPKPSTLEEGVFA